jgi:hypothetical protein
MARLSSNGVIQRLGGERPRELQLQCRGASSVLARDSGEATAEK